ncbi:MAG TPA: hypothetical protein VIS95_03215 [Solirubrobacterales bacterium]
MSGGESWKEESAWNVMHHSGISVFRGGISAAQWGTGTQKNIEDMFKWTAERDIVVLPYLYGRPSGTDRFLLEEDPEWGQWEAFLKAVVQRFGYNGSFWSENPSIPYHPVGAWEIWNEPNLAANNPILAGGVEKAQPQNYAKFMVRSAHKIREAQGASPTQIVTGGLYSKAGANGMSVAEFLQKMKDLEKEQGFAVGSAFDAFSLHPYSFEKGLSGVQTYVNEARSNLSTHFGNKQLWITELGWNVSPWGDSGHQAVSESQQATNLTESFNWIKSVASEKNINLLIWYFFRDVSASEAWDYHAGLRRSDGSYRPAWDAFQAQTGATPYPDPNPYSWHSENIGGYSTSDPDALTAGQGHIEVFARGSDGALWTRSYDNFKWNSWSSVASSIVGGPGATWGGGKATAIARLTNATVHSWWWDGSWLGYNLGGNNTSDPDLSSWGTTRMDMFVRGSDNALWHRPWNSGTWGSWESLGGTLASGPAAVSWGANRIDVVTLNSDANKTLSHRWYDGTWHCCTNLGGVNTSDPDITATAPGHLVVAVRGSDFALWIRQYDVSTGWGGWEKIGGSLSSGPTAVAWSKDYRLDLFAQDNNHALSHWWWGPSAPH